MWNLGHLITERAISTESKTLIYFSLCYVPNPNDILMTLKVLLQGKIDLGNICTPGLPHCKYAKPAHPNVWRAGENAVILSLILAYCKCQSVSVISYSKLKVKYFLVFIALSVAV